MNIRKLISEMTLEEKASMCSGSDGWHTQGIDRLNIPAMRLSDGPHGLRKQKEGTDNLGIQESIPAVCFPAGCALAASFDRGILKKTGQALGEECQAENVGILLGPGVNIKRSPLCGRNFEYYSEDPFVSSELAAAYIEGVQEKNIGACIKHFFANNQETRRFSASSELDERTAREIYLAAFENAVKKAKPKAVMCAYNRINGIYAAENKKYLNDVLRDEWGFDGLVVSDWGAVNDRVPDLKAGTDLEMPPVSTRNDERIVEAVKTGKLDEQILDRAVERILNCVYEYEEKRDRQTVYNHEKDHETAKKAAAESMVLLKNNGVLPLNNRDKVAVIGEFALNPRFQGGGSSHINAFRVESFMECVCRDADVNDGVTYVQGFHTAGSENDLRVIKHVVEAARNADKVLVFAGLPESYESEGYDRENMRLPEEQNRLIREIAAVNENIIVVLHNGAPVEMPWIDSVSAVLETYLSGEAVGAAVKDVLYGKTNPCGRLPETFPVRLEDTPVYPDLTGEGDRVCYREGVFVGYRYYDTRKMKVLFPFGYGLSYTDYTYSNLRLSSEQFREGDKLIVSVDVTNVGDLSGKEVIQLYIKSPRSQAVRRPVHELKGFTKIFLRPGETKTAEFELDSRSFSWFCTERHEWFLESGEYEAEIAKSSQNVILRRTIRVLGRSYIPQRVDIHTPLGDILRIPGSVELLKKYGISVAQEECTVENENEEQILQAHYEYMPLRARVSEMNDRQIHELNQALCSLL